MFERAQCHCHCSGCVLTLNDQRFFRPELRCVFREVTYESISDPRFREALAKSLTDSGGQRLVAQLFSEHDAAPEV